MNLLNAILYDPATVATHNTTALLAMTAFDTTNLRLNVVVPAHGFVRFRIAFQITGASTYPQIHVGVLNGSTVVARVTPVCVLNGTAVTTTRLLCVAEFVVGGLTPGSTNFDAAYGVDLVLASTSIKYGGPNNTTATDAYGAFVFEAWDPQPDPTNFGLLSIDANGRLDVIKIAGTTQTARDLGASVLFSPGTGTGQLDVTSGVVKANTTQFGGTNGTFSGGRPEVNATHAAGTAWNSGAIGPSTLASDTFTAAKIAADAVAEIQSGLATLAAIAALNNISAADVHSEMHDVLQDVGLNLHLATISSLTSQTSFSIATGSSSNDAYNDCVAVIRDEDNSANLCVALISDYTASGRVITLGADPGVFTIAVGDSVAILPKDASVLASIAALNNLSQADIRTAVGLASASLDTQLGDLPTNSELATALGTADDATLSAIAAEAVKTSAIKAKTDNLPASPAATGDVPSAATVASQVRTELTTELSRVDVAISTRLASGSYTAPLDASGTRVAIGLAAANLDTQLGDLPTAAENAAAILAAGDLDGYTLSETLKLCMAALVGKLTGAATTTITIRAADDSADRIVATVDADGNRSAITLNASG